MIYTILLGLIIVRIRWIIIGAIFLAVLIALGAAYISLSLAILNLDGGMLDIVYVRDNDLWPIMHG